MISFDKSMEILNSMQVEPTKVITLPLMEALDYVLAQDIVAEYNSPEYPTSGMDGYALKYEDQTLGELEIQAINPAGATEVEELIGGKAIKTFTGSLMPEGSDTLIPIENVEVIGNSIKIIKEVPYGFSVREVGENFKKDEVLIKKGTKISFSEIGVLASLNYTQVKVYDRVKVGVIATGEELLELGEEQTKPTQIRSSNNYTIEALAKKHNAKVTNYGCVGDDLEKLKRVFKEALSSNDIVVSTGGVSVGDFDFVKDVVKDELEAEVLFKGVIIKPGQHIMLAKSKNKTILALPGFAYSSTVTALLYLVPLIYKYQHSEYNRLILKAKLLSNFTKKSKKTEFTPCNLYQKDGELFVDFRGKKDGTSAIMTNMIDTQALVVTKEDDESKKAGEYVNVFIFDLNIKKLGGGE